MKGNMESVYIGAWEEAHVKKKKWGESNSIPSLQASPVGNKLNLKRLQVRHHTTRTALNMEPVKSLTKRVTLC
jgi:hypothetical protein